MLQKDEPEGLITVTREIGPPDREGQEWHIMLLGLMVAVYLLISIRR